MLTNSLCFYFPYHEDSGVPVLFYRLANFIANDDPGIKVYLIDYENGAMARNMAKLNNLKLISYKKGHNPLIPNNCILIMQSFIPYYWPKDLKVSPNQKFLFWNLHPLNFYPSLLPFPLLRELLKNNFWAYKLISNIYKPLFIQLRKYVDLLLENESLVFMDKTNLESTSKYLFLNIHNQEYLPVPVVQKQSIVISKKHSLVDGIINIGWIGRLCDFKSHILIYTINKLSEISYRFKNKKFVYHIVGEGPYLDYIKKNIKLSSNVSINYQGSIPHDKLDGFIEKNLDILTAMGTSALEGAKLGKPTILLDFIYKKIKKDYKYRMLYDTENFDLGHSIGESDYEPNNDTLFKIINDIIENYNHHSNMSFDYFKSNHSIETTSQLLLQKAIDSKLTFSMIDSSILNKGFSLRVYNKIRKL